MGCLCVFAGAATGLSQNYMSQSYQLGEELAKAGHSFIYGGGRTGLMGSFADGVISQKGNIHGIIPAFLEDREVAHKGVTQLTITESMHERKTLMYEPADGFLILPGGLGTLDETMEVLTWRQLNKLDGPVFTFSIDCYWEPMRSLLSHIEAQGFANTGGLDTIYWHDHIDSLVEHCNKLLLK